MNTLDTIISQLLFRNLHSRILARAIDVCVEQGCETVDIESPVSVRVWLADGSQGWNICLIDGHGHFTDYVQVRELYSDGSPVNPACVRDMGRSFSEY